MNILRHANMHTYFRVGSYAAFGTFAVNGCTLLTGNPHIDGRGHPEATASLLVAKALWNGLVWVSIPWQLFQNAHNFAYLNSGGWFAGLTFKAKVTVAKELTPEEECAINGDC